MKITVTGAAGFIGSSLCEALVQEGHFVTGIDRRTYLPLKKRRLQWLKTKANFSLVEADLARDDLENLIEGSDFVYHLAARPGVRTSWGGDFSSYAESNIVGTQRLLEACLRRPPRKFVYASTSSVYGEKTGKMTESQEPAPLSPYGVSKLCGEHLCHVYRKRADFSVAILRYFTVYGPRQRPDMAFHRFMKCLLFDEPIPLYGDGRQTRDFTYIEDCVKATVALLSSPVPDGEIINIGGTETASLLDVISLLAEITGKTPRLAYLEKERGEAAHTSCNLAKARRYLRYEPQVPLKEGLQRQWEEMCRLYGGCE